MTGLFIAAATVLSLIVAGFALHKFGRTINRKVYCSILAVSSLLVLTGAVLSLTSPAMAAEGQTAAANGLASGLGFIAAALVTGLACVGAAYAVANVGAAAIGLVGEKPEMLGTTLIYLGLAEGIAIYGIIISLMIMQRL